MNIPEPEPLLTMTQVCRWLQADRKTVRRLIKAGKLRATKLINDWRFDRVDVAAFLDSRRPKVRKAA